MEYTSLTARYRPQTFGEVAGQTTLKTILSRAALEGKVAPAYLLSGTRGVGKTTLARVFAKALNCRTAPTAEPCNQCDICRSVTQGNAVDVVEIDGASNRGIDDVRRLREVVGYAPMDGRYKVFIIDEAHMLSREAFNALLKTLEEPPPNVVFIMATTEAHKFPPTIISRCQHYVFKRLTEAELIAHLTSVLEQERIPFETAAVSLLARRGAGSVRDAMSLLGQVLAYGHEQLTEETVRTVLGLAGQDVFVRLLEAFSSADCLAVSELVRELLDGGLDIGFFMRELAQMWRNLFILRQTGEAGLTAVPLPLDDARALLQISSVFSLTHLHGAWQMVLEGQRRVLTSLEPALALELLLLNLAMLPELLSLEQVSSLARQHVAKHPALTTKKHSPSVVAPSSRSSESGVRPIKETLSPQISNAHLGRRQTTAPGRESSQGNRSAVAEEDGEPEASLPCPVLPPKNHLNEDIDVVQQMPDEVQICSQVCADDEAKNFTEPSSLGEVQEEQVALFVPPTLDYYTREEQGENYCKVEPTESIDALVSVYPIEDEEEIEAIDEPVLVPDQSADLQASWEDIVGYAFSAEYPKWFMALIRRVTAEWCNSVLTITPPDSFVGQRLSEASTRMLLEDILQALQGKVPAIEIVPVVVTKKPREQVGTEVRNHEAVTLMESVFDAFLVDFGQIR